MGMLARYRSTQFADAFVEDAAADTGKRKGGKAHNKRLARQMKASASGNICFAFQKGKCTRGAKCVFTHELTNDAGYGLSKMGGFKRKNGGKRKAEDEGGDSGRGGGGGYGGGGQSLGQGGWGKRVKQDEEE